MRFLSVLFISVLVCNSWAGSLDVVPAMVTDSLIATMPLTPPDPYEELEKIPSAHFQNLVVRAERSRKAAAD